ncbi:MAG: NYN domain-containing protein [Planctomycetes bacterium]|nr:NYN domain-containing protein [Planctomycetota bacterium]MCG2685091.1 NYN domain-containing protein [Planctomycetales bacterium]
MPLLIDGYNLLHASGIMGHGAGPGSLERSRLAMLNFLAASIEPSELPRTTVVFDAGDAPRGLPRVVQHRGITVRFAAKYESADELIEELIRSESAPRRLVVVSGDRRIQRAARRRRAKVVASDAWYAELVRARRQRAQAGAETSDRPPVPLLEEDVNYWIDQFGGDSLLKECGRAKEGDEPFNPFPPDYGKDLEDD